MSTYIPQINDYVYWRKNNLTIEGWVYFVDNEYITIEIGVKCKNDENVKHCPIHKKTHCLIVCYPQYWHELKYIKNRRDVNEQQCCILDD